MDTTSRRRHQCVLLDWGDTVMRVFPEYSGPMETWPRVEAMPGVGATLRELRSDALVCLATNAADSDQRAIRNALARVALDAFFDHIFCFEVVGFRKPTEAYYRTVIDAVGLEAENVFMVGDDFEVDVLGATKVGINSVWLNQVTDEDKTGDSFTTVHSFEDLPDALERLGYRRS